MTPSNASIHHHHCACSAIEIQVALLQGLGAVFLFVVLVAMNSWHIVDILPFAMVFNCRVI